MWCPRCQAQNRKGIRFCEECGARLEAVCPSCGAEVVAGKNFCGTCGAPLGTAQTESRFASPDSYTPKYLAEKILTSKNALEGERKQVTVLFADMKGSMELLADRDPEEARAFLDPVLELMMEAVHRYEGTVNQVMGDGIMALFGAPIAHEDHAVRACYAALRMLESVKQYADEPGRRQGMSVDIRVGLNSGEVVVRSIGSDLRMDYSAVGQTTQLAARMEQMARPGSSLVAAATARLAEGFVRVNSLGTVKVKGLTRPVEVCELVGAGPVRTRPLASPAWGLTPFVGRQMELETLRRALRQSGTGHGQVVAVLGEPGVGKTRLFYEFTGTPDARAWLILQTNALSYGKATPYLPVIDLLRAYFQIEDRDEGQKIREKITGKLLALDADLETALPALLALLDVSVDDPQWQALDPPERRQRTLDMIKRLLLRESQIQPLCVVVENLHWNDSETEALLDSLVESLPTARLLLLTSYRPEYRHHWGSKTYYTQVRLDPLPPESAAELLGSLMGEESALRELKQLLIERTEGNPFFLEECLRDLVETKVLVGERGGYRLAKALPGVHMPPTVQTVLAARIDRLPPEEKRLLQSASVIGKYVPFALLQAIAELPDPELRRGLAHLQAAEFLYETSLFPNIEYTFKHALTHEVAYGSLLQERRLALHARIMKALEVLSGARLSEHVERLAHHAFRGEVWDKALHYLRRALNRAGARSAYRESVRYFDEALAALAHLPPGRETLEQAIDLRVEIRQGLFAIGELGRIGENLRDAESMAQTLDDQCRLAQVSAHLTIHYWTMGEYDRSVESGQRALAIATSLNDIGLEATTRLRLAYAYHSLGDYGRAARLLRENVASLTGDLVRERFGIGGFPSVFSRAWLAWCLTEHGDFAEALKMGQEGVRIAETVGQPWSLIAACFALGLCYLRKGEFQSAIQVLEGSLPLCRVAQIPLWPPYTASALGLVYAQSERLGEGIPLLEQAVEEASSTRIMANYPLLMSHLGEAYLLAGRLEDGWALAQRALELSRARQERGSEAYALRLLVEIASRRDPLDIERVQAGFRDAWALADELRMRPLAAHCHLGLGRLYRRTSRAVKAREHLTTATTMYREMDMRFWLEKAEADASG